MNITELRDKRAKLWTTMEGFLDTHRSEKGVLSAEDDAIYANMEKELNDLTNEIHHRKTCIAGDACRKIRQSIQSVQRRLRSAHPR